MGAHRIVFWSAEDGATSLAAFPTMEDVAAAVGGGPPEPWSAQIASQRTADGNAPEERRTQRTGRAEKDLHVVTLPSEESAQLILVHRHGKKVLAADAGAKHLMDNYLHYKTRASLHLDGFAYNCGDFRILLLRATQRPSNRLIGIAIDVEALALPSSQAARGILKEVIEMFREAAIGAVPGAKVEEIEEVHEAYGLAENCFGKENWGVQLVQLVQHAMGT